MTGMESDGESLERKTSGKTLGMQKCREPTSRPAANSSLWPGGLFRMAVKGIDYKDDRTEEESCHVTARWPNTLLLDPRPRGTIG